jgi:hypothetical protein
LLGCVHGAAAAGPTNVERCLAIAAEFYLGALLARMIDGDAAREDQRLRGLWQNTS